MKLNEKDLTCQFFQELYGLSVMEEPYLADFMNSINLKHFSIGESINMSDYSLDDSIILLSGKIRVLQKASSGRDQTVCTFIPADIWDKAFIENNTLNLLVSSEEVVICSLPAEYVLKNSVLKKHLKIDLPNGKTENLPDNHLAVGQSSFAPVAQKNSSFQQPEQVNDSDTYLCIKQAIAYYKESKKISSEDCKSITHINELAELMEKNGLQVKLASLTWNRLLNAEYPLILSYNNSFHWITGRKGNSLIEKDYQGQEVRLVPERIDSSINYDVISLRKTTKLETKAWNAPYSMGWYLNLCFSTWFLSSQMVLSSILIQLFALGMPIFYIVIFDRVFGRQNLSTLDVMAVGIILVLTFDMLVKVLRSYVLSHQLELIDKTSMETFLARIFNIPLSKSNPQNIRSFTERFPELIRFNQTMISTLLVTSLDVAFSVILVVFLLLLHFQLAFISLASLIPIAILSFSTTPLAKKRALRFAQEQRQCQIKLSEVLENKETVQSMNADHILRSRLSEKLESHLHQGFGARFDRVSGPTGQGYIAGIGAIVTLYFGAHEVLQGEISYGVYVAINMLSRQVVGSVQKLFASILMFYEALETMDQFKSLYIEEQKKSADEKPGVMLKTVTGNIKLVDVCFRYQTDAPWVLKDINLNISAGQKIVLIGKSGSGKTTLVRLLQRLYEPNSGYISLDGFKLVDMDVSNLRSHVGVALQKPGIFTGTIRDNITLSMPSAPMKNVIEAASMAQLDQVLLKMPQGFDTPVAPMGTNFSGGQVAQIALARVLLMKPDILIMDEALSPCDPSLQGAIFAQIFEKYRQKTAVFVTDYVPVHQQADRIIVLNEGQVVEQGTYQELIQLNGYYTIMYPTGYRSMER